MPLPRPATLDPVNPELTRHPKMETGYCYEYTGGGDWRTQKGSEGWDIEVYTPTGGERYVTLRRIDGTSCAVFACPDGVFRAANVANVTFD